MDCFLERARLHGENVDWSIMTRALDLYAKRPQTVEASLALAEQENALVEQMAAKLPCPDRGPEPFITDAEERWALFTELDGIFARNLNSAKGLNATILSVFLVAPIAALHSHVQSLTDAPAVSEYYVRYAQCDLAHGGTLAFLSKGAFRQTEPPSAPSSPLLPAAPSGVSLKRTASAASLDSAPTAQRTRQGHTRVLSDADIPQQTPPLQSTTPPIAVPSSPRQMSPGNASTRLSRSRRATQDAKMRDKNRCVLSGLSDPEAAHIFPFPSPGKLVSLKHLLSFWGKDKCDRWLALCEDRGVTESARNLLCLNRQLHAWWEQARFALKPISCTANSVTVQFHWTRRSMYTPQLPVTRNFEEALGQERLGRAGVGVDLESWGNELAHQECGLPIRTGQLFTIESSEGPEMLPDWELLALQWDVLRVAAMSGAGEVPDDYDKPSPEEQAAIEARCYEGVYFEDQDDGSVPGGGEEETGDEDTSAFEWLDRDVQ